MTLEKKTADLLSEALTKLDSGFSNLPEFQPEAPIDRIRPILLEVAEKMKDNFPYQHPYYLGQMLKPPHPVARMAYALSLWINPNNHALDGGRASSAMEKEAVREIAAMFGWNKFLGHLTSGGTFANLEALWISGKLNPGKLVVASDQAHYTHNRICNVLQIPFKAVPTDSSARIDVRKLRDILDSGNVGTVVATIGTTATGSIDPLIEILELQEQYGFRIHADAAYGGYYILADNLTPQSRAVYDHLGEVDSIVVDPHKHGLQPYGCGCVLFKDPGVGRFYKHESPYTYFTSDDLHLGEISLECSRAGSSAVALWATQRMFPLERKGEFAGDLESCRKAALELYNRLVDDPKFMTAFPPELDIVIWAVSATSAAESSKLADLVFDEAGKRDLHLAKANLPRTLFTNVDPGYKWDQETITCLRSCLMKPEHLEWMDRICKTLSEAVERILGGGTT